MTGNDVYRSTLGDARSTIRRQVQLAAECHGSLQNKDSDYAAAVKAMLDLHRAALEIRRYYRTKGGN